MNRLGIISEYFGMSEEEYVETAKELLIPIANWFIETNKSLDDPLDYSFLGSIILGEIVIDGEIDDKEYNTYCDLCYTIGITPNDLSYATNLCNADHDEVFNMFMKWQDVLNQVFTIGDRMDLYEDMCRVLVLVSLSHNLANDAEGEYIDYYCENEAESESGSDDYEEETPVSCEPLQVVRHGVTLNENNGYYYLSVGVELVNPNVEYFARNVNVRVNVYDNSGRIIGTSDYNIEYIDSNATFYFGDEICTENYVPVNYDVNINCDDFEAAPANSTLASGITCSHYNVSQEEYRNVIDFTGNVTNNYDKPLNVELYFVFYDENDNITGGCNSTYLSTIYPHSSAPFNSLLYVDCQKAGVRVSSTFDFRDLLLDDDERNRVNIGGIPFKISFG